MFKCREHQKYLLNVYLTDMQYQCEPLHDNRSQRVSTQYECSVSREKIKARQKVFNLRIDSRQDYNLFS